MREYTNFSKADTHLHTSYSDGSATPAEMVEYIVAHTDLSVIAVTDHDTTEGAFVARSYARQQGINLDVIIGQEVTTDEGDMIGLFLRETLPQYPTAAEAVQAIKAQGGLAIAAHPFSYWSTMSLMHGVGMQITELPLDGVEVRNGFPANFVSNPLTAWMNRRRGLQHSELGGSDSHVPYTAGQAFTRFPGQTGEDLRRAILKGQTHAGGTLWTPASIARIIPMLVRSGRPQRQSVPLARNVTAATGPVVVDRR